MYQRQHQFSNHIKGADIYSLKYLDDLYIRVKSRWEAKMQDPIQPGSKQKHNVSLEKSS